MRGLAKRSGEQAQRLGCVGPLRRSRGGPGDEPERGHTDRPERPARSSEGRDTTQDGPEERPADRRCERGPIRLPRRPAGDIVTSQASAPVHENALASPCRNRVTSSCHGSVAIPKSDRAEGDGAQPDEHGRLDAGRAATMPLGIAPANAPAG